MRSLQPRIALRLEGAFPERALMRLARGGISLFFVKKVEKTVLLFQVKKKDIQKAFAICENLCYNSMGSPSYRLTKIGVVGAARLFAFKNRAGLLLGMLAFCALLLFSERMIFGVELEGSRAYARDTLQILEEYGVKPFSVYPKGREEEISARLLSLKGVEFCSVQKRGGRVRVVLKSTPLTAERLQSGDLRARRGGTLVELTVLRGAPLKTTGEEVREGDTLVGGWISLEEGGQVCVEPIARARIACVYEGVFEVESKEEAFANAYLLLSLSDCDGIESASVTEDGKTFHVKINYFITEKINL